MQADPCTPSAPTLCGAPAAGEGSYGQLVRRFGAAGAERVVSDLGAVWISHIHADHHAGLPRLLAVSRPRPPALQLGADPAPSWGSPWARDAAQA